MTNHFNTIAVIFLLLYFTFSISYSSTSTSSSTNNIEVADQLKEMRLEINQLNRKSGLLELKNVRQDGEIRLLKTILSSIVSGQSKNSNKQKLMEMHNRAARLMPLQLLMGREKVTPIVGPPSSCKDLNQLGHTLNGIYLIKTNSSGSANSKMINAIFCDFQPDSVAQKSSPPFIESRLGYVDVKSADSGIYFYVQIGNRSFASAGVLRYDRQVFNTGGGMNLKSGVFTAPKAGIYTFSFSILKNGYSFDYMEIILRLNGIGNGSSTAGVNLAANSATLQSTLKLKKGDRVDLWKTKGELSSSCSVYCHHFTGSLMEEDLTAIM